jgi:hypothetical protein
MWRYDGYRIDISSLEQRLVIVGKFEFMRGGKWSCHLRVDIASGHDLEARASGKTRHNLLAPPAEADNSDADHCSSFLANLVR